MVLIILDSIWQAQKENKPKLYIATPRNEKLFEELVEKYSHINIIKYPWSMGRFLLNRNTVITSPTPGKIPLHQKISAWIISRRQGSKLIGFEDGVQVNKFLFDNLMPFRTDILIIDLLFSILKDSGINFNRQDIIFNPPDDKKNVSWRKPTIVFHPFGSSAGRSILGSKMNEVVSFILESFPKHVIYISGSSDDSKKLESLEEHKRIKKVAGKLSMSEICDLLKNTDLYIGVDTGITHMANSLGIKTLVIAEQGTPHWLPYYNSKATIVYQVKGDDSGVNDGREYLESKRDGRVRYLDRVPLSVIKKYINEAGR